MKSLATQRGIVPVVALIIVVGTLVGGGTVVAISDSAKPGDPLYLVDTSVENLRLNLTTDSQTEVDLRTEFAAERVAEVQALLAARDVNPPGLAVALANLTSHKAAIADLVAKQVELKARAKALEDLFEQKEKEMEAAFNEAERKLKLQRAQLKAALAEAIAAGNTSLAESLRSQIQALEAQLDALEAQEEAAEEALEAEEERLEAQFDAEEEALEAQEEALEEQEEGEENDDEEDEEEETEEESED